MTLRGTKICAYYRLLRPKHVIPKPGVFRRVRISRGPSDNWLRNWIWLRF